MIEISGNPRTITKDEINQIAIKCFRVFNVGEDKLVEIVFLSKDKIQSLNLKHRNMDKPTDVLSFPQIQIEHKGDQILGSIAICEEQALDYNENVADLIKHGFLHLLGHDHHNNQISWNKKLKMLN